MYDGIINLSKTFKYFLTIQIFNKSAFWIANIVIHFINTVYRHVTTYLWKQSPLFVIHPIFIYIITRYALARISYIKACHNCLIKAQQTATRSVTIRSNYALLIFGTALSGGRNFPQCTCHYLRSTQTCRCLTNALLLILQPAALPGSAFSVWYVQLLCLYLCDTFSKYFIVSANCAWTVVKDCACNTSRSTVMLNFHFDIDIRCVLRCMRILMRIYMTTYGVNSPGRFVFSSQLYEAYQLHLKYFVWNLPQVTTLKAKRVRLHAALRRHVSVWYRIIARARWTRSCRETPASYANRHAQRHRKSATLLRNVVFVETACHLRS